MRLSSATPMPSVVVAITLEVARRAPLYLCSCRFFPASKLVFFLPLPLWEANLLVPVGEIRPNKSDNVHLHTKKSHPFWVVFFECTFVCVFMCVVCVCVCLIVSVCGCLWVCVWKYVPVLIPAGLALLYEMHTFLVICICLSVCVRLTVHAYIQYVLFDFKVSLFVRFH